MYKKVKADMKFAEREKEILDFWKKNDIFSESVRLREGKETFTFYDGPPTANGRPHIGHILTRVIKDIIPRYKTMKGYKVPRKAGWDTHGLPVELEVEKMLGINGKSEIESYGVKPFIEQCKKSVWNYKTEWEDMSFRVGFWADMDNPYITYENNYIESVWWALKKIWDNNLIYKGHKIVPYCPRCGTSLSSHEVAQGYKDIKEESIYVRFKVRDEKNTYLLAWTTTPWTLPSNVALSVNEKEKYVKVKVKSPGDKDIEDVNYYLARERLEEVLEKEYEVVEEFYGKDLLGKKYEPLTEYADKQVEKSGKDAFYVTSGDFVTLNDGTGIVHIAPAFGEDDTAIGRKYDLPFVQLVDSEGNMTDDVTDFAGVFCKEADAGIIDKLKAEGKLIKKVEYEHNYPFCWRCDTSLIYYARDTWFIEMTKVKERLISINQKINWMPENIKNGRFGNFLENLMDWSISRERYWGTPLPIWECKCTYRHMVGSVEELKTMSINCPEDIELHKPYIDDVRLRCPECSGTMKRVSEVIDCWFDSGSMPFAQWHYPFENKELFEEQFPANFISEAVDQTRGWFYTLLAISTLLFDETAFENCIVLGLVLDKDGIKMSKHKGNVVDPNTVLDKQGADAVRWYFYTASSPWLPSRFSGETVSETQRKFMGTFWNTYAFFAMYAQIDNYVFLPKEHDFGREELSVTDRWILSRLNTLVKKVDSGLEKYDITGSARAIADFADELSNWYVRRNRERFWAEGMEEDKIKAYSTLYKVLVTLAKLSAPFVPFMTESIYQNLVVSTDKKSPASIHLCDFPVAEESYIDDKLESHMADVLEIVALGRAARNNCAIKNRQPLGKMYIMARTKLPLQYLKLIEDELNVKKTEYIDDESSLYDYEFKPHLKTLGRKMGKLIPKITAKLKEVQGKEAYGNLEKNGELVIKIDGEDIHLSKEDILVEKVQADGVSLESDKGYTVALSTELSEELIEEGFVREVISKVQTMRKEAGFEVLDRIRFAVSQNDIIMEIVRKNEDFIKDEVLADLISDDVEGYIKEWNINGETVKFSVKKTVE